MTRTALPVSSLLTWTLATAAMLCGAPALAAAPQYIGYHGPDGGQVYPDSDPPVEWDSSTGHNVLWQTPLPYVSYGGVVAVKGRVFLMSEFGFESDFPELVCVDGRSGKVLWKREINHLPVVIPDIAKLQRVANAWRDHLAWRREHLSLKAELATAPSDSRAAVAAKIKARGMLSAGKGKVPANASPVSIWRVDGEHPEFGQLGLNFDAWRKGFGKWWPGATYPTPCTDGQFVYVATAWRQYACFDLGGNLKWIRWFAPGGDARDKVLRRADSGDGCGASRSPLLWKDLFIADTFNWVRALDRGTGRTVWEVSRASLGIGNHEVTSPVIMTVPDPGGESVDVLWCNGPLAIRLADGRPLKIEGWASAGMMAVLNTDRRDTLFLTGGGEHGAWVAKGKNENPPPAAVRFALHSAPSNGQWEGTLKATVLWNGLEGRSAPSNCASLAYHGGKLYYANRSGVILDPDTGKILKGSTDRHGANAVPPTGSMFAIAGGRIYGTGTGGEHGCEKRKDDLGAKLVMNVYSLDGKHLATNALYGPKLEGRSKAMRTAAGIPNWFSYSMPFTVAGDRIYVRGCFMLYCIGRK